MDGWKETTIELTSRLTRHKQIKNLLTQLQLIIDRLVLS